MQSEAEKTLVLDADLPLINAALRRGSDVRITQAREGVRILEEKVKVLKKPGKIDN